LIAGVNPGGKCQLLATGTKWYKRSSWKALFSGLFLAAMGNSALSAIAAKTFEA